METPRKIILSSVAVILTLLFLIGATIFWTISGLSEAQKEFNKHRKELHSFMGKQVVIKNDTLEAIDYDIIKSEITLSNNTELSLEYIKTKEVLNAD